MISVEKIGAQSFDYKSTFNAVGGGDRLVCFCDFGLKFKDVTKSALSFCEKGLSRDFDSVLREVSDGNVVSAVEGAFVGFNFAHDHAKEGSLTRTVSADEPDAIACADNGIDTVVENLFAEVMSDLIDCDHSGRE